MTEERDEILDELRALISIEPAPGFEARVRRQVAERASSPPGLSWIGAIATVVAVVVVVLVTRARPVPDSTRHRANAAMKTAPMATAAPEPTVGIVPVRVRASTVRRPSARKIREPEVLVPPDQAMALRRLVAAVRAGQFILAPSVSSDVPVVVEPLPDIAPLKIEALPSDSDDRKPATDSKRMENHAATQA